MTDLVWPLPWWQQTSRPQCRPPGRAWGRPPRRDWRCPRISPRRSPGWSSCRCTAEPRWRPPAAAEAPGCPCQYLLYFSTVNTATMVSSRGFIYSIHFGKSLDRALSGLHCVFQKWSHLKPGLYSIMHTFAQTTSKCWQKTVSTAARSSSRSRCCWETSALRLSGCSQPAGRERWGTLVWSSRRPGRRWGRGWRWGPASANVWRCPVDRQLSDPDFWRQSLSGAEQFFNVRIYKNNIN